MISKSSSAPGRTPRAHLELTIIAQDPTVAGDDGRILTARAKVPWARLEAGPRGPRFHVVDYDATTGTYTAPADLPSSDDRFMGAEDATLQADTAFHSQQVYAVAARTLEWRPPRWCATARVSSGP